MSNQSAKESPSMILMAAPVAFVLLGYNFSFYSPQQSELKKQRGKLSTLGEQEHQVGHDLIDARRSLAKAKEEIHGSEADLEAAQLAISGVEIRRDNLRSEVLRPTSPARTMRDVARLLEQQGLTVVQSEREQATGVRGDGVLRPLVALLEGKRPTNNGQSETARETYRVTIAGAFPDLRVALQQLAVKQPLVLPLAIEMEESAPRSKVRTWYLTLMV